jgi:hypothetical protein
MEELLLWCGALYKIIYPLIGFVDFIHFYSISFCLIILLLLMKSYIKVSEVCLMMLFILSCITPDARLAIFFFPIISIIHAKNLQKLRAFELVILSLVIIIHSIFFTDFKVDSQQFIGIYMTFYTYKKLAFIALIYICFLFIYTRYRGTIINSVDKYFSKNYF